MDTCASPVAARNADLPTISMVTPSFNQGHFIEHAMRSILTQEYPRLEYVAVDGGSVDNTIEVLRRHADGLAWWTSEPDQGVYDALNKGFSHTSGEIMGWLNSSDMLHPRSLFVVGSVFQAFPEVHWITGIPTGFDETGMTVRIWRLPRWSRVRFLSGINHYIEQESTFWRRSLWEAAGGHLSTAHGPSGDFELWVRFFRHAKLFPVHALIGGHRSHPGALSSQFAGVGVETTYNLYAEKIIESELRHAPQAGAIRTFRRVNAAIRRVPKLRGLWYRSVIRPLYTLSGTDSPPRLVFEGDHWTAVP